MSRVTAVLILLLLLLAGPLAAAQDATPGTGDGATPRPNLAGVAPLPFTAQRQAELAAYVAAMLAKTGVPGAAIAVVQDGQVFYQGGFGVRELGQTAPVTPDTLMMIGSVTKSMTATMAATIVDDGLLTWDTPVVALLPEFAVADPELTQRLTARNAFCACTGLPARDAEFVFASDALTPEGLIASVAAFPLTADPGEEFQYSNQMFAIGGYAATAAVGTTDDLYDDYVAAMQQRLLDPMAMPRSTFSLADVLASGDYAGSHGLTLDGGYAPVPLPDEDSFVRAVAPAGALWSSVAEMARYLQTELAGGVAPNGVRVVSPANLGVTWEQQVGIPADPSFPAELTDMAQGYALGWLTGTYQGQRLLSHDGSTFGFTAQLALLPDADLGLVVLANAGGASIFTLGVQFRLLEVLFGQPVTLDPLVAAAIDAANDSLAAVQQQLGTVEPDAVSPYLGRYTSAALGDVEVRRHDDTLILDVGEFQTELRPYLDESGAVTAYLAMDPPLSGLPATFELTGAVPVLTLTDPTTGESYRLDFTGASPPQATPDG